MPDTRPGTPSRLQQFAFAGPTGLGLTYLLRENQSTLLRWNLRSGGALARQAVPAGWRPLCWLDGGRAVAFNANGGLLVWDARTESVRFQRFDLDAAGPFGAALDGRLVTARSLRGTGAVRVLEAATGAELATVEVTGLRGLALSADGRLLALACADALRCWDVAAGQELWRRQLPAVVAETEQERSWPSLLLSADARRLYSVQPDQTALAWPVPPVARRPAADLATAWADLASADAGWAWRAIWSLADRPAAEVVAFLRPRLLTNQRPAPADVARLLRDLDADAASTRDRASRKLAEFGEDVLPELRQELARTASAEVRRRVQALVDQAGRRPGLVTKQRAVTVLEYLATADAQTLLRELAAGPGVAATEAKLALERFAERVDRRSPTERRP